MGAHMAPASWRTSANVRAICRRLRHSGPPTFSTRLGSASCRAVVQGQRPWLPLLQPGLGHSGSSHSASLHGLLLGSVVWGGE